MNRSWIKTSAKVIAATVLILLVVAVGALATMWWFPSTVINEPVLKWVYDKYLQDDYPATWQQWDVQANSKSFWRKSLKVQWRGVCFKEDFPRLTGCFEQAVLGATFDLEGFDFKVERMDPLILKGSDITIEQAQEASAKEEKSEEDERPLNERVDDIRRQINSFLGKTELGHINIDLKQVRFEQGEKTLGFSLAIQPQDIKGSDQPALQVKFKERTLQGYESPHQLDLNARLISSGPNWTGRWTLDYEVSGMFNETHEFDVKGVIQESTKDDYLVDSEVDYRQKRQGQDLEIRGNVRGMAGFNKVSGRMSVRLEGLSEKLPWVSFDDCDFRAPVIYDPEMSPDFFANCTTELPLPLAQEMKNNLSDMTQVDFPDSVKIDVRGELASEFVYKKGQEGQGQFHARLHRIRRDYLLAQGEVSLDVQGEVGQPWPEWELKPRLDLLVKVEEFSQLSESLRKANLGIPAPFNVLKGELWLRAQGELKERGGEFRVPLVGRTHLRSETQRVNLRLDGAVMADPQELNEGVYLNLGVRLDEVALQLPPLKPVAGFPSLFPDARFKDLEGINDPTREVPPESEPDEPELRTRLAREGAPQEEGADEDKGVPFEYRVSIETQKPESIKLYSNLAEPYVPIALDLVVGSDGQSGAVNVSQFNVSYLRRQATIQNLSLNLPKEEGQPIEVDGLLVANQADYEIFVKVVGTLDQPRLHMWSNPPLPRDEIIAVLLFNRRLDELAGYEEESVGSVEAAVTDGAIGLLGLWAFASTPIQSVSYNPETQTYAAKVALDEDLTMTIGGDWERVQTLQLRKRLARNWLLSTTFDPTDEGAASKGELLLQWQNRY